MMLVPCFRHFTKNSLLKFSYYLKKSKVKRNQFLYKAGEEAKTIFIIKNGEFEITRNLPKDVNGKTENVLSIFGLKSKKQNIYNQKLAPEIDDIPST